MVRENHRSRITNGVSMAEALSMGAMALFGEKYGDTVRIVEFGNSVELCGGTHVESTGSIGIVKIISEAGIAAGVRRIEAVTASKAEEYINGKLNIIDELTSLLKSTGSIKDNVEKLISENSSLRKLIDKFYAQSASHILKNLDEKSYEINNIRFISGQIDTDSADILKTIAHQIRNTSENSVLVVGTQIGNKAHILVMVSDKLVKERNISAVNIIKEISAEINGSGGGQPFLAIAGGKNPAGIGRALQKAEDLIKNI
jgi:alanyl-tRNA synthetase